MRVLIVTQYFWPENFRINDLSWGLAGLGHEVLVLTGKPNYPAGRYFEGYGFLGRFREKYGPVTVLRVPLLARRSGRALPLMLNYLSFVLFGCVLGPLMCRGSVDVILVYEPSPVTVGLPAIVLKAVKRAPILFWVQDLWPESLSATDAVRSPWILRGVAALVRLIYRRCDRVLVQSRAFVEPVLAMGVPADRVRYFPNSAEPLYRPACREEGCFDWHLPQGFRVMFAGNIGAAQSFDTILDAAEALRDQPDIHWLILGQGRRHNWVEAEVDRRGLRQCVHLFGQHPVETMPQWFAQADVLLVTLKRDQIFALTLPSKIQSYMACALPIVAALEGEGARVVQEARAGIVVAPQDAPALARAVMEMFTMPRTEREAMGRRGRAYFLQEFERDALLARLDSWMKELAARGLECES